MENENKDDLPFVSVVMTVLNMERTIKECLESLINLDYPKNKYEIIVVDGKSKDRTKEIVQSIIDDTKEPEIRLYEKEGLVGVGRNEAFSHSKGDFIAITDGDMVVPSDWLSNLIDGFEDDVAGVGGPNDNADKSLITTAISCIDVQGPSNDVVPLFGDNPYTEEKLSGSDVYTTVCRNTAYRKKVLDDIKGFDERIISCDDPELNIKILKKGYKLKYTPNALVKHHHRSSISGFYRQQRRYAVSQAIVNKIHPELYRRIQPLPFVAFIFLLILIASSFFVPNLIYLVFLIIVVYAALYLGYGLKCAMIKHELRLIYLIPIIVLAWHWAWVVHYPKGLIFRKKVLSGDEEFIKKFSKMY
ncbi:MAG: glycosyltransferase [Thermoplasmata archaeon]|nr:MAG: glycosyltransferase [Thermoplasmata archaeon]